MVTEAETLIERIAAELARPPYDRDPRDIAYLIDRLILERIAETQRKPKVPKAA